MAIRSGTATEIILPSVEQFNTRTLIRQFLLNQWISESPNTQYRYIVETLANGDRIYLQRPGPLNKGCDFVIYIENIHLHKNGNDRPPNYDFLTDDLKLKKATLTALEWNSFLSAVAEIFSANPYAGTLQYTATLPLVGLPYETTLKLTRWFFIEQDITYWLGNGRQMLYNGIINL